MHSPTLYGVCVTAVGMGQPLLVDNVAEPIPLILAQLLQPRIVINSANSKTIQIGAKPVHYSPEFRLFLCTERMEYEFSKEFLQMICVVNVMLGARVIQHNLMELFLDVNAFQLTSKRDELIEEKTRILKQIDRLEEGMLEQLSRDRSVDLENDKAIEMLSQVQAFATQQAHNNAELVKIEVQLNEVRHRFYDVAECGARLVNAALCLAKLSPFYARTIRYYFDIFTEAVAVDVTQLSTKTINVINENLRNAFLKRISKTLFGEHRNLFEFVVTNNFDYETFSQLTEKHFFDMYTKHSMNSTGELNLRQQVTNMKSHVPLIMLLSFRSNYVIRMLYALAEQMPRHKASTMSAILSNDCAQQQKREQQSQSRLSITLPASLNLASITRSSNQVHGDSSVQSIEINTVNDPNLPSNAFVASETRLATTMPTGSAAMRKIQVIPVDGIDQFDYELCLQEDQWLVVQNCQLLNNAELAALQELVHKISESSNRKISFRMFIVMYPEGGEAPHQLLDQCDVLTVDETFTLNGFLLYCYSSLSPAALHEKFQDAPRRELLYRLCCFHFALLERIKYGVFGFSSTFLVTISNFEAAVALFKELLDEPSARVTFQTILKNVLEVAYLGDISIQQDIKAFGVLAMWIFQGLSSIENSTIEALFRPRPLPPTVGEMRTHLLSNVTFPPEHVLSGLHPSITAYCKRTNARKLFQTIRHLLSENQMPLNKMNEQPFTASLLSTSSRNTQRYSSGAMKESNGGGVDVRLNVPMPYPIPRSRSHDASADAIALLAPTPTITKHMAPPHQKFSEGTRRKSSHISGETSAAADKSSKAPISQHVGLSSCSFDYCIQVELQILAESRRHNAETESYLKGLLRNRNTNRIILGYFQRPIALFEIMKLKYAKSHNVPYNEMVCYGTLKFPGSQMDSIELAETYLLAADFDAENQCLRESSKPFTLLDTVWVVVRRRPAESNMNRRFASLSLYHRVDSQASMEHQTQKYKQADGKNFIPILDVNIETALPESHWLLRGAKFTTFLPCIDSNES